MVLIDRGDIRFRRFQIDKFGFIGPLINERPTDQMCFNLNISVLKKVKSFFKKELIF